MEAAGGDAVPPVSEALEERLRATSFFRAVWLLERLHPGSAPVGGTGPARQEAVRLRPSTSLSFPTADVTGAERMETEDREFWRITTPLLGLYGVTSPLPSFYSEDILQEELREESDPVRLFLDLVNHRLLALLYRAWSKYRWEFTYEPDASDETSRRLLGWLGLATPGMRETLGIPAERLLRYAGAISQRPRSASLVSGVLADWFDVPVRLAPCVARWVRIAEPDRSRLGHSGSTLGEDLVVGERILDRGGKCRIEIGPIDFDVYATLHPGGGDHAALHELTDFMLPDRLAFDLRFQVRAQTVPALRLTSDEDALQLGWSTWIGAPEGARLAILPGETDKDVIFPAPPERRAIGAT